MTGTQVYEQGNTALSELAREHEAARARVDEAHHRMLVIAAVPHPPLQARGAARELTTALSVATDIVVRALHAAALGTPTSSPGRLRRRRADRSVPAAVRPWSAELVRLAEIGVWLRRTTLDDTGVSLPMTVRVADYAAKGPHIAGLDFGNQAAPRPGGPRIGIDLAAAIDAASPVCPGSSDEGAWASTTVATVPPKAA